MKIFSPFIFNECCINAKKAETKFPLSHTTLPGAAILTLDSNLLTLLPYPRLISP